MYSLSFQNNVFQMLEISFQLNPSHEGVLNTKKKNNLGICSHPGMTKEIEITH